MANNTQYRVQTLAIKTGRWGGQIVNFEKKAFGWRELGSETGEELTGVDTDTGRIKSRAIKVRYYSRPSPIRTTSCSCSARRSARSCPS